MPGNGLVAGGPERTVAQHEFVRALCCRSAQGDLFARPMQAPALEAWRREREAQPAAA